MVRLSEIVAARGSQDAGSRNLASFLLTHETKSNLVGDGPPRDIFDGNPGDELAPTLLEGELLVRAQLD